MYINVNPHLCLLHKVEAKLHNHLRHIVWRWKLH